MPDVLIPCPRCGKNLKLRDRSKLGRLGKCPACQHKFVLEEPEEVELELLDEFAQFDAGLPALPLVGEGAAGATSTLAELRRRCARHRRTSILVGAILGTAIGAAILVAVFVKPADPPPRIEKSSRRESVTHSAERAMLRDNLTLAREASPTDGEPIRLMYVPTGANVIVHLRPAELWSDERPAREFRACFGETVVSGVETWIQEFCKFAPQQVEELLICFILPVRGQPPQLAAVVRTVEPQPKSQLLEKFRGELNEQHGFPIYVADQQVYMISDDRHTIAIAPNEFDAPAELAESMTTKRPSVTKDGILDLLARSDRQRHITLVFEPLDVRLHQQFLIPERARDAANVALDWFGEDVETVAWSLHRGEDRFFSQMYLRNQHVWTPTQLQNGIRQKLARLPREIYEAVRKMRPPSVGARTLIGRFPAMVKVFSLQTLLAIGHDPAKDRFVQLTTVLPERAGPNLVLASLLAWDESTRTDFSQQAPPQPTGPRLPDTVAERLQKPIEFAFEREPLELAFQYIGRETGVAVEVDGKALEAAGMTRNVPQTHALGTVPALQGIAAILARHEKDGLCIVVDEPQKRIIVTTKAAAELRGEKPFAVGN
ncbi:MAG TPA: hypothetical protein VML55_20540 [Planctomycetaceae bacterium]|nr:hypothetical protein [Planctomycetaceae bacterium]